MAQETFKYIVVGAGLAGCGAVEGIRTLDTAGSLLLTGNEKYLPYDRPPLTKKLWLGKKKVEEIFVHNQQWFVDNHIDVMLNTTVIKFDTASKTITFKDGSEYQYEKLLLATGGAPRKLDIEEGNLEEIYYYRYLDDFLRLKANIRSGTKALVIGGGFIGSEIAASLNVNKVDVTMIVKGTYPVEHIFPKALGNAIQEDYIRRRIKIITEDKPASIARQGNYLVTHTKNGKEITSEVIISRDGRAWHLFEMSENGKSYFEET